MPTRSDLAKIHIAIKEVGLSDQEYRDLLRENFNGATSSKQLSGMDVRRLLNMMQRKGWRPRNVEPAKAARPMARDPQSRKIRALWLTLKDLGALRNPSEDALARYVKKMTGVDALQWLKPEQHNLVIESLKSWVSREKAKRGGEKSVGRKQR